MDTQLLYTAVAEPPSLGIGFLKNNPQVLSSAPKLDETLAVASHPWGV